MKVFKNGHLLISIQLNSKSNALEYDDIIKKSSMIKKSMINSCIEFRNGQHFLMYCPQFETLYPLT